MNSVKKELTELLNLALLNERDGIGLYKDIYRMLCSNKEDLSGEFNILERKIRRVIVRKEEYKAGLYALLGQ